MTSKEKHHPDFIVFKFDCGAGVAVGMFEKLAVLLGGRYPFGPP
jgi:hypothetical protein